MNIYDKIKEIMNKGYFGTDSNSFLTEQKQEIKKVFEENNIKYFDINIIKYFSTCKVKSYFSFIAWFENNELKTYLYPIVFYS